MSVALTLFQNAAALSADRSIATETHPTMQACEAADRAARRHFRGRGVFWACMTRAPTDPVRNPSP